LLHFSFVAVEHSQFVQRRRFSFHISNAFTYFQRLTDERIEEFQIADRLTDEEAKQLQQQLQDAE
jgi:hypothetical protein